MDPELFHQITHELASGNHELRCAFGYRLLDKSPFKPLALEEAIVILHVWIPTIPEWGQYVRECLPPEYFFVWDCRDIGWAVFVSDGQEMSPVPICHHQFAGWAGHVERKRAEECAELWNRGGLFALILDDDPSFGVMFSKGQMHAELDKDELDLLSKKLRSYSPSFTDVARMIRT